MKHDFYALQAGGHWFEPSISHESRKKFRDFLFKGITHDFFVDHGRVNTAGSENPDYIVGRVKVRNLIYHFISISELNTQLHEIVLVY
jgi:hypothetical protein